jgi:hypothetical protein
MPHKNTTRSSSGKRELIKPKGDARYVRRTKDGRFSESDDVGKSQVADRRRKAKRTVKSGQGDRGDRKRVSKR